MATIPPTFHKLLPHVVDILIRIYLLNLVSVWIVVIACVSDKVFNRRGRAIHNARSLRDLPAVSVLLSPQLSTFFSCLTSFAMRKHSKIISGPCYVFESVPSGPSRFASAESDGAYHGRLFDFLKFPVLQRVRACVSLPSLWLQIFVW